MEQVTHLLSSRAILVSAIVLAAGWAVKTIWFSGPSAPKILPSVQFKDEWTLEEISEFNGQDDSKPILMGIEGKVYEVSKGRDYYGKDGGYKNLAGRDASRMLAKNILDPKKDNMAPLTDSEKQQLKQWKEFFDNKYPIVGKLRLKSD